MIATSSETRLVSFETERRLPDGLYDAAVSSGTGLRLRPLVFSDSDILMFERSQVVIFGAAGVGKSFVALNLAVSIAAGTMFLGQFDAQAGGVFYVASEGEYGLRQRIAAHCRFYEIELAHGQLICDTKSPGLADGSGKAAVALVERIKQAMGGTEVRLVVFDTLDKCGVHDSDQNHGMSDYLKDCQYVRDELGCAVLSIHHSGHTNKDRIRGGSALVGGVDTLIHCHGSNAPSNMNVVCQKQKEASQFSPFSVRFESVRLPDFDIRNQRGGLVYPGGSLACGYVGASQEPLQANKEISLEEIVKDVVSDYGSGETVDRKDIKGKVADKCLEFSVKYSESRAYKFMEPLVDKVRGRRGWIKIR